MVFVYTMSVSTWINHYDMRFVFTEYNEKVVAFLRTPNISEILKAKNDVFRVTPSLWTKLSMIRNEGHDALVRLSNDVELIILLR